MKIVVPFAVGGSADVYARFLGAKLSDALGQPFVVENRPGGGAVIGTDAVAKSPADGYTILMMSNTHTVNETLIPKKPYDLMKDLAPITGVNYQDLLLVVNAEVKANNLREFIALAKSQPGKLNYASSGPGTPYHMAGELFKHMAGVNIVHVPHKGSDQARTAVLGGQVEMMFDAISTMVVAHARRQAEGARHHRQDALRGDAGRADCGRGRRARLRGHHLARPDGAGRHAARRFWNELNQEINKVINAPDVKENWGKQGAVPMGMPVDEFAKFLREDVQKWSKLVKDTGMKVD